MLHLICDSRETKLNDKLKLIDNLEFSTNFKNLELGDFIFSKDEKIILIIERKTTADLFSSIRDGRYKEQKIRLLNNYKKTQILYIIEGDLTSSSNYQKNFNSIVKGSILNMIFRDTLPLIRSKNSDETLELLISIGKKIIKNPEFFNKNLELPHNSQNELKYEDTIKISKKQNMTPKMCNIVQLCQIPGVSTKIANIILESHGSISNLIITYNSIEDEPQKKELLKNLVIKNEEKTRKLGPKLSERIYEYLTY